MFIGDVIKSLEARFEKFVGKKLDQKEQSSRTVIEKATKTFEARLKTFMFRKFNVLKGLAGR